MASLAEIIDELESGVSVNSENRNAISGELGILKTSCVTSGTFNPKEHKAVLPAETPLVKCPVRKNSIIVSRMNTEALVGANAYVDKNYDTLFLPDRLWQTVITNPEISVRYVSFMLASEQAREAISSKCGGTSGSMKNIAKPQFLSVQIPLPPLEVQHQIVAEIEGYQKIIDGARQVLDNYSPHIAVDPTWPIRTLSDACKAILTGPFGTALHESDYVAEGIPVINPKNIVDGQISRDGAKAVAPETRDRLQEFTVRENDIVIGRRGEMGRCAVVTADMNGWLCGTGCFVIRLNEQCDTRFAHLQISSPAVKAYLEAQAVGVTMMNLNQGILSSLQFPLPDLEIQRAIVAEIEAEQTLVAANRELIRRMEAKVKAAIDRVWGSASAG